jgi:hypothetical protein
MYLTIILRWLSISLARHPLYRANRPPGLMCRHEPKPCSYAEACYNTRSMIVAIVIYLRHSRYDDVFYTAPEINKPKWEYSLLLIW